MRAVLDASVLVRAVLPGGPDHAEVRAWMRGLTEALAPHLLPFELTTAIRRLEAGGQVLAEDAEVALAEALRLRVTLRTPRDLHVRSLHLARALGVSRTQDAAYLALALSEGCPLYTLDERFIRNAAAHGYPVRHPAAQS
ncbi:MAG: type II toxin-antitoxin system VapC family toxin [Armatimonadota bacterium]|nr:type II toxin-antitoxin system VapC family toxin [Armatimonadota bacterium]